MLKNLLLFSVSIVVTLLIFEIIIRVIGYERTTITPLTGFHEYDPELGWKLIPDYRSRFVHRDFNVEVRTNSDGLRDEEYSTQKNDDTIRVVSLGDSFTWGWGVENDEVYMQVAEDSLDGFEIINMGQNGYGTGQELLLYKRLGHAFSPDLVALGFFYNDLTDNVSGGGKPLFDVVGDDLVINNGAETASLEFRIKSFLVRNSHLFVLANYGYERLRLWLRQLFQAPTNSAGSVQYSRYVKEPDEESERRWTVFEKIVSELKHETNDNLLIIYIPDRTEVETDKEDYINITSDRDIYDIDYTRKRLGEMAAKNNIPYMDITEIFRDEYSRNRDLYLEHDRHMSKAAHKLAGELMAEELREIFNASN